MPENRSVIINSHIGTPRHIIGGQLPAIDRDVLLTRRLPLKEDIHRVVVVNLDQEAVDHQISHQCTFSKADAYFRYRRPSGVNAQFRDVSSTTPMAHNPSALSTPSIK